MFDSRNQSEPVVRFLLNVKDDLNNGEHPNLLHEMIDAFNLEQIKQSDSVTVYRSKADISAYLNNYPDVFARQKI